MLTSTVSVWNTAKLQSAKWREIWRMFAVGVANHLRKRVWLVGYSRSRGRSCVATLFELAVTMKLCVLFICGALVSTFTSTSDAFKAPALHIKDLGKRQLGHCSAEYVEEFIFTGIGLICASTLQNASTYEEYNEFLCTGACAEAYLMLYAECNSPADAQFYRANCGRRDPDGKLCANIDTEQSNLGSPVLANATSNCPDSDSCSEACKASVEAGKETYGQ